MRTLVSLLLAVIVCTTAGSARGANVAVLISADVQPYREALRGFKDTTRHEIVAEYDMAGDFERGREFLRDIRSESQPDLVLAMGIWALQVAVQENVDLPVVFAMVLNPPAVLGSEPKNVTGASMNVPIDSTLGVIETLGPRVHRIGLVYDPARTGYLVENAKQQVESHDLTLRAHAVGSPKEAIKAITALQKEGVDALWLLPDPTVLDPKVVEYALLTSYRNKIPLLGLSERQAEMGAVVSVAFGSSEDIGRQAGDLVNEVLSSRSAGTLPYTTARTTKVIVNLKAAEKLGLNIPESLMAMADIVIR